MNAKAAAMIRILLVDDHSVFRRSIKFNLESNADLSVVGEASTGAEGVEKAQALKPDVVVLDLSMPGMNGLEAARRIRDSVPQTAILILSQYDIPQIMEEAKIVGAQGYLVKSNASRDLIRAIETLASGRAFGAPNTLRETTKSLYH
ncbi:MAG TPA: response regulator transcription factor [Terriglobales bacterium]|nr:response regulator transcription factor [Terriglobales bacterium]